MAYRVIQWATGTVGVHALRGIIAHPDLELAGLWVHSDAKAGQDAGALVGLDPVGVTATQDAEALLALDADCVCYTASSDVRPSEVVDDLCRILRTGKNVVNTSFVPLLFPAAAGPGVLDRLTEACEAGGTSIYTNGIDPGYGNDSLPISMLSLCERVDQVRCMEIVNYATWDNAFTLFEIMGFGKPDASHSILLAPGSITLAWGPVVHQIAAALDVEVDEVVERKTTIVADTAFEIVSGPIPAGTISGMRFEIIGMVGGREAIIVEHVTRMRDEDAPDWPKGSGYRIEVTGEPNLAATLQLDSDRGDHNTAGCLATAMRVLNSVPAVVDAAPGVVTTLDIPLVSARHLMPR